MRIYNIATVELTICIYYNWVTSSNWCYIRSSVKITSIIWRISGFDIINRWRKHNRTNYSSQLQSENKFIIQLLLYALRDSFSSVTQRNVGFALLQSKGNTLRNQGLRRATRVTQLCWQLIRVMVELCPFCTQIDWTDSMSSDIKVMLCYVALCVMLCYLWLCHVMSCHVMLWYV